MEFPYSFLRRHFAGKPVVASRNVGFFLSLFFQLLKIHIKLVPYQKVHQSNSKEKQAQKKEEKSKRREWIQRIVVRFTPLANGAYEGWSKVQFTNHHHEHAEQGMMHCMESNLNDNGEIKCGFTNWADKQNRPQFRLDSQANVSSARSNWVSCSLHVRAY